MLTTEQVNYITYRDNGTISYLPAGKTQQFNDDGKWSLKDRVEARPAKVMRKIFTDKALRLLKDFDFECFSNSYKSNFCQDLVFELLPNDKIPEVYNMSRADGEASLNESCMNGLGVFMDIYKSCPQLQILILKNKQFELCGRALVWSIDDIIFMDRIYVSEDFMYDCFLTYATKFGWWRKKDYKSHASKMELINPDGFLVYKLLKVEISTDHNAYPYIDTLTFGGNSSLNNYGEGMYCYNDSSGAKNLNDEDKDDDDDC
jgi:hypothetical protein